MILKQL
jgi:hypothetical protein